MEFLDFCACSWSSGNPLPFCWRVAKPQGESPHRLLGFGAPLPADDPDGTGHRRRQPGWVPMWAGLVSALRTLDGRCKCIPFCCAGYSAAVHGKHDQAASLSSRCRMLTPRALVLSPFSVSTTDLSEWERKETLRDCVYFLVDLRVDEPDCLPPGEAHLDLPPTS